MFLPFYTCCLALLVVLLVLLALLVVLLVLLVLLTVRACICNWCWSWRGRYGCHPHQGWSLDPATPHYRTTTPAHTHLILSPVASLLHPPHHPPLA